MYGLMPNTRVRFHAAVIGGLVGGTLWQLNSQLSTMYLSRVVTYSKIYGGMGIVPVFLLGLYFSWLIVLLGAQVSFAAQNVHLYMQQRVSERMDQAQRELLACRVVLQVCASFLARRAATQYRGAGEPASRAVAGAQSTGPPAGRRRSARGSCRRRRRLATGPPARVHHHCRRAARRPDERRHRAWRRRSTRLRNRLSRCFWNLPPWCGRPLRMPISPSWQGGWNSAWGGFPGQVWQGSEAGRSVKKPLHWWPICLVNFTLGRLLRSAAQRFITLEALR